MHRANVVVSSVYSSITCYSIARSYRHSLGFACGCGCRRRSFHFVVPPPPSSSAPVLRSISFLLFALPPTNCIAQQFQYVFLQRNFSKLSMRRLTTNPHKNNDLFGSSFASKAFVATATVSATLAAYYCATAIFFSSIGTVNGDTTTTTITNVPFHLEKKKDENYGIEYVGFDSYPGIHLDDGTGVATKEVTASSALAVSRALEVAGLDETGILAGITFGREEKNSLHPNHAHRVGMGTCPVYGCPLLPLDVHYDEDVKAQLTRLRKNNSLGDGISMLLNSAGSEKAATLTLVGYKGGRVDQQINQDRALALAPYSYHKIYPSSEGNIKNDLPTQDTKFGILIGAFDGHAKFGERVSEYVVKTLPALLGSKLVDYYANTLHTSNDVDQQQIDVDISRILRESFLELDATSPAHPSGGCTASIVLQLGSKIYVANAGDSRSFIAAHVGVPLQSTNSNNEDKQSMTKIIFATREDKPHIPTERDRVEHMGGTVFLPNGFLTTGKGTTRVLYQDPTTGSTSGLAMSRSIGDWDAGVVGVIPDPLIDILDMKEIKKKILDSLNETCIGKTEAVEIDPATGESKSIGQCVPYTEEDVKIFAVSATDGLLDYLPEQSIVNHVAKGLYGSTDGSNEEPPASHPLLACEDLIYAAAQGWQDDKGGRYRDDIAIAVADLEA